MIQQIQEREEGKCFFVLRLDKQPDSAYVWNPDAQAFCRYIQQNSKEKPRPNGDMVLAPTQWAALAWMSEAGLQQFTAWPEFQALDETYKVYVFLKT
jgi:hypothetical protein